MNIHEYQAKAVLREFGAPLAKGVAIFSADEAEKAARELGSPVVVVKAQIHAGGRGKGRFKEKSAGDKGGVRLAKSPAEVAAIRRPDARRHAGHQAERRRRAGSCAASTSRKAPTSPASSISPASSTAPAARSPSSPREAGGMDIEEVAAKTPEKIVTVHVDPAAGYSPHVGQTIAFALGLSGDAVKQCVKLIATLYEAFVAKDMSLLEINPLVVTKDGELLCLDAKINFDDNALFRHPDIAELRDPDEEDPNEVEAAKNELNYIALDGTIGCMVNGAGLAMATMDIIKLYGAEPANFLDVGGGATKEKVTAAFKIITADPKVKGVLVNIFGGIMRCDVVAEGIIAAVREVGLTVPLVVRLEGTNVELGKKIIAESGLNVINADDLDDAAQKVVAAVGGA